MAKNEAFDEEMDRREYRRKRRIRNQMISYVVLALFVIGLAAGGIIGVKKIMKVISDKRHTEELQKQLQELAEKEEEQAVVEAPAEPEEPVGEVDYLAEIVESSIAAMPLEDKVAGLFIVTPEVLTDTDVVIKAGDTTREKLGENAVGGLIYSAKNFKDSAQLTEMLQNTKVYSKYPIFLGVEEEGGAVSRVAEAGLADNIGPMGEIGASGDTSLAQEAGTVIGEYLAGFGFNLNFGPVADVTAEGDTVIGDRSFGGDVNLVSPMVAAAVTGMQDGGISVCLKYFPGLGSSSEDVRDGMAATEKTLEEFQAADFPAFQAGIDAGAELVMVSHLSVPGITGDNTPCSLSPQVITDVLRGQLGYQGIVVTDAMNVAAIMDYYTDEEAAVKALQAGADMILMPDNYQAAYQGVLDAVNNGTLSEDRINESLRRIYRVKKKDKIEE